MNNVFIALSTKRKKLHERKLQIRAECDRQCRVIDDEIRQIDEVFDVVNKAFEPYLCPACGGSGNTRRCDAAGQMEDVECDACHGTGINVAGYRRKRGNKENESDV